MCYSVRDRIADVLTAAGYARYGGPDYKWPTNDVVLTAEQERLYDEFMNGPEELGYYSQWDECDWWISPYGDLNTSRWAAAKAYEHFYDKWAFHRADEDIRARLAAFRARGSEFVDEDDA